MTALPVVGKSIENKVIWTYITQNYRGFCRWVLFSVIASYLVSKYYIEIAEENIYLDHNPLIVGVLELSVI
jgi:hypothetical protein